RTVKDQVSFETRRDLSDAQIGQDGVFVVVMRTDPGHASQSPKCFFSGDEKAVGDAQPSLAGITAEDLDQGPPSARATADAAAPGRIVSLASPSTASRRIDSQSSRVISTAGPCSPSSSFSSSSCLARRF